MSYYSSQLDRVITSKNDAITVVFNNTTKLSKTKNLSLNSESLPAIISKLTSLLSENEISTESSPLYFSTSRKETEKDEENKILEKASDILLSRIKDYSFTCDNAPKTIDYLKTKIGHLEHEVFTVLFLDNKHRLIAAENMFRGTIDGASVYPREVAKRALQLNAAALILSHNHPSGNCTPSQADRQITNKLKDAVGLFDIRVLDHIIVSLSDSYSFAENGGI